MATGFTNFIRLFDVSLANLVSNEGYVSSTDSISNPFYECPQGKFAFAWVINSQDLGYGVNVGLPRYAVPNVQTGNWFTFPIPVFLDPVEKNKGNWVKLGAGDRIYRQTNNVTGFTNMKIRIREFNSIS